MVARVAAASTSTRGPDSAPPARLSSCWEKAWLGRARAASHGAPRLCRESACPSWGDGRRRGRPGRYGRGGGIGHLGGSSAYPAASFGGSSPTIRENRGRATARCRGIRRTNPRQHWVRFVSFVLPMTGAGSSGPGLRDRYARRTARFQEAERTAVRRSDASERPVHLDRSAGRRSRPSRRAGLLGEAGSPGEGTVASGCGADGRPRSTISARGKGRRRFGESMTTSISGTGGRSGPDHVVAREDPSASSRKSMTIR